MSVPAIPTRCDELATQIVTEHEKAQAAARSAVEHAQRAGTLLLEAKAAIPHGEWGAWIRDRLSFSERTAQSYMRVARLVPTLDESKAQRVADLPLRQALAELAERHEPDDSKRESLSPAAKWQRRFEAEGIRRSLAFEAAVLCVAIDRAYDLLIFIHEEAKDLEQHVGFDAPSWKLCVEIAKYGTYKGFPLEKVLADAVPPVWPSEDALPVGAHTNEAEDWLLLDFAEMLRPLGVPSRFRCAMSEREKYAERIRQQWRDGVRLTIEAGQQLIKAKNEVSRAEFNRWLRQEGPRQSRRVSQHMAVSRNPVLTDPAYWSSLPVDLEVLYELSCLPHELLEMALEDGEIRPDMSRRDVLRLRPEVQKDIAARTNLETRGNVSMTAPSR